jgi:DNA-binding transcriptional regulator YiaG
MPNIATALKSEITRLSRKEVKAEVATLLKTSRQQRQAIAGLRKQLAELERKVASATKSVAGRSPPAETPPAEQTQRFSAKGLATHRKRLGLSAEELGRLLGASGQSVYNWESGQARPRPSFMPAIVALRTLGKKQAREVLAHAAT